MRKKTRGGTIDEAYQKIKSMMYNKELVPGQKLFYQGLAQMLNLSTTPIAQSLDRLARSNLVVYKPNKGYFVGEITETEAKELFQAREAIELYLIPLIIANLDHKKLMDIERHFKEYQDRGGDRRLLILKDARFHLKIAEFARNGILYGLLNQVLEQVCIKYRPEYIGNERFKEVVKEHWGILQALEKGDADDAGEKIKEHLKNGMDHVINSLRNRTHHLLGGEEDVGYL
ncbi:MAG: GntR family transcriptional regulator [Pseudomonadota bacterium]